MTQTKRDPGARERSEGQKIVQMRLPNITTEFQCPPHWKQLGPIARKITEGVRA